jgi:riboflavin synthase
MPVNISSGSRSEMFTGIVEEIATLAAVTPLREGLELTLAVDRAWEGVKPGDSVAVDGVCLTAVTIEPGRIRALAAAETLKRSTLGHAAPGRRVHVERALRLSDRLGGHIVQGHVDGCGSVVACREERGNPVLAVEVPPALCRYVVAKGSVAIDGVSLTVNRIDGQRLEVMLVPHTVERTTLATRRPGDRVNIEVDLLAKYVERLLGRDTNPSDVGEGERRGVSMDLLVQYGFTDPSEDLP